MTWESLYCALAVHKTDAQVSFRASTSQGAPGQGMSIVPITCSRHSLATRSFSEEATWESLLYSRSSHIKDAQVSLCSSARKGMTYLLQDPLLFLEMMKAKGGYVYIVSNKKRNVLNVGVTSDLYTRIFQHKSGSGSEFTKKYKCFDLIYYKFYERIESAIEREKKIKKWNRAWKDKLIEDFNPERRDLFDDVSELN